jgi:hypothetical protein
LVVAGRVGGLAGRWSAGFAGGAGAASSPVIVNGLVCIAAYDNSVYGFAA